MKFYFIVEDHYGPDFIKKLFDKKPRRGYFAEN